MIEYKYSEDRILAELKQYIDKTYGQHYSLNKFQTSEFIIDCGHGEGFFIGNIMKYAQRYGKAGKELVLIGVNFDSAERRIEAWKIERN